jgi:hypothetical protein
VLSHSSLLETIEVKRAAMTEHYVTQLELQDLQERHQALKEKAKVWLARVLDSPRTDDLMKTG